MFKKEIFKSLLRFLVCILLDGFTGDTLVDLVFSLSFLN
jgi:hypothetical protein